MTVARVPGSFLRIADLSAEDLLRVLDLAEAMKAEPSRWSGALAGRTVALLFQQASARAPASFSAATHRLGAFPLLLRPDELQPEEAEPIADTARVLAGYCAAIVARSFAQPTLEEIARAAETPVVNARSDEHDPCQALADLLTLREQFGRLEGLTLALVGDTSNIANSLIEAATLTGIELRVAAPPGCEPSVAGAIVTHDSREAVWGADAVYTEPWGKESTDGERDRRRADLTPYRVDAELMTLAAPGAVFLHCLPARRGEEVAAEVIDGRSSAVWQQAANRLPIEQALLYALVSRAWR